MTIVIRQYNIFEWAESRVGEFLYPEGWKKPRKWAAYFRGCFNPWGEEIPLPEIHGLFRELIPVGVNMGKIS